MDPLRASAGAGPEGVWLALDETVSTVVDVEETLHRARARA
jgi:hypothetical protein